MNNPITDAWSRELLPNETLLWSGKPDPSVLFTKFDIFYIPFSMIWIGFSIFWLVSAASSGGLFAVFGLPLIAVGFYITVGRFFYKQAKKRRTVFAITSQRVLSAVYNTSGRRVRLTSSYLQQIQSSSISVNGKGIGTIQFGQLPFFNGLYVNSGMDFLAMGINDLVVFVDIEDADKVYEIYKAACSHIGFPATV